MKCGDHGVERSANGRRGNVCTTQINTHQMEEKMASDQSEEERVMGGWLVSSRGEGAHYSRLDMANAALNVTGSPGWAVVRQFPTKF